MRRTAWAGLALLVLLTGAAGCLGNDPGTGNDATSLDDLNPFTDEGSPGTSGEQASSWPPENVTWDTSGPYSETLTEGPYEVRGPERHRIESHDGTTIDSAVWRPDVPTDQSVPVVLFVTVDSGNASRPLTPYVEDVWLEDLVPHGFAFAQVSIRGTGESGGCNDYYSPEIRADFDGVIDHYANRSWSNGNVAAWGVSDSGIAAWAAAATGNPHLETVVPSSAGNSLWHMAYRNGTPTPVTAALPTIQWGRWASPVGSSADRENNRNNLACPGADGQHGAAIGAYTAETGAYEGPVVGDYWTDRNWRDDLLADYEGSVFVVQGLDDWTTHSAIGWDTIDALNASGNRLKVLLGQWHHGQPDEEPLRRDGRMRWDHAETLKRWLTDELTAADVATGPAIEVQDDRLDWRTEEQWPPEDRRWTAYHLGDGRLSRNGTANGRLVLESPADAVDTADEHGLGDTASPPRATEYVATLGPVEDRLRFSGLARLPVTVSPTSPEGARLYAELVDVAPDGTEDFVTHATMDLRYHEGGTERHQLTPGQPITARMEFFPADAVVEEGHELRLRVTNGVGIVDERFPDTSFGEGAIFTTLIEHPTPTPVVLEFGENKSVLELPEITRDVGDGCYAGQPDCG